MEDDCVVAIEVDATVVASVVVVVRGLVIGWLDDLPVVLNVDDAIVVVPSS